jgi:hypothetical protein
MQALQIENLFKNYNLNSISCGRRYISRREEVTGERSRLHNKDLYALYSSPNIIGMIKSRIMT